MNRAHRLNEATRADMPHPPPARFRKPGSFGARPAEILSLIFRFKGRPADARG